MSGMEMADLSRAAWRKSSRSTDNGGQCVEVAAVWRKSTRSTGNGGACVEAAPAGGAVAVRDSKHPDGAHLTVAARQWEAFARSVKTGRLPT